MAFGVLKAAHDMGVRVPQDLSVIGFDNRETCAYFQPTLTSIELPLKEMGYKAADSICRLISGDKPDEKMILLPCRLIKRDSVAAVPADD